MPSTFVKFLIYLLIIFSLFPYIQILPLGTDSQPNALCLSLCLYPFCCKWKMNKNLFFLFLIMTMGFLVVLISPLNFNSILSFINYFTLFFVSYVTFYALKKINGIPYKLFKIIVYIWFIVGTIQIFINPDFMSFLLPRGDSALTLESGRGIVCLAPEPTFYGLICLFFAIIAYLNFRTKPNIKRLYYILGIQLFLYSRSSLVIFLLIATLGIYIMLVLFTKQKILFKIITPLVIIAILLPILTNTYEDTISKNRFGFLLLLLLERPDVFITLDGSINERFIHIFFPLYGCIRDLGLPHGYGMFPSFLEECMNNNTFHNLFSDYVLNRPTVTRIMSGWGSIFYELGVISFLLIYIFYNLTSNLLTGRKKVILLFIILSSLLNAIPFSNPIISFLIGNMLFLSYEKRKKTCSISH